MLAEVASAADRGSRSVDAVWGTDWTRSATVVVGTREDVEDVLGPMTGLPAVAVTWVPAGSPPGEAAQVLIDKDVWSGLPAASRLGVLTHELVHVATGSVESTTPRWLEEGLADYIAWTGTTVPVRSVALEALEDVAQQGPPAALPADAEFELGASRAAAAYGEAYVAARLLAQTYGEPALLEIYRATNAALEKSPASGSSVPAAQVQAALADAVRQVTGETLDDFLETWRAELVRLAAGTP